MKLKRYFDFIKESLKEDVDNRKFWSLHEDDIRELLLGLTDEGWLVTINFGFEDEYENWKGDKLIRDYTEKVLPDEEVTPAYWIEITPSSNITSEDVTDDFLFAFDTLKDRLRTPKPQLTIFEEEPDTKIEVRDHDGVLNKDDILIKGGLFIGKDLEEQEQVEARSYLAIFANEPKKYEFTQKQVSEYYGWECDYIDDKGNIYIHIDTEDLAYELLERNAQYLDILSKGMEVMWDHYESHYYIPETDSFFNYSLDKENEVLMVKSIIKESGGWNVLKDENIVTDIEEDFNSEEDFINYVLKERFYDTLKDMCVDSEICQEIKQTVADWEMSAHVDQNYDAIISNFDSKVADEFEYSKIEKEVKKYYTTTNSEGEEEKKHYTNNIIYYQIEFDKDWIREMDAEDLFRFENLLDIFKEYCGHQYYSKSLNPSIYDYGDVDRKAMNSDIKNYLTNFLKRD